MKKLLSLIKWDLMMQVRYNIIWVAIFVTLFYSISLYSLNLKGIENVLTILIFSDPSMLGFLFIGALILFEKDARTLSALTTTPMKVWHYLWSKAISLTLIAIPCSFVIAVAGHGWDLNWLLLFIGVFFSSIIFVFLGFTGVARVNTFNQYIIVIPLFMAPICLPFLNALEITNNYWFYLIPSQASLLLIQASFEEIESWQLAYAFSYLIFFTFVAFYLANYSYKKYILEER